MKKNASPEIQSLRAATDAEARRRAEFDAADREMVAAARLAGAPWETIGEIKGLTRRGACARYQDAKPVTAPKPDVLPGKSVAEFAAINGITEPGVHRMIASKRIAAIKVNKGNRMVFRITE